MTAETQIQDPPAPRILDRTDRNILRLLQADASMPLSAIAEAVSLTPTPCWKRIRKLEQDGVIVGRATLLDPAKVGLPICVFVAIETADHSTEWLNTFATAVAGMPEIMETWRMSGDVDYMLRVVVPDIASYDAFYRKLIAAVPLRNVTSRFAMECVKSTTALPL